MDRRDRCGALQGHFIISARPPFTFPPPHSFLAETQIEVHNDTVTLFGEGYYAIDLVRLGE